MMSTKAPVIWCLVVLHAPQHECKPLACSEEKHTKKNKEEAAEYAKHLDKRMKDAEEKCQKQIVKIHRECFTNNTFRYFSSSSIC
ncbi:40S ribosomal protein S6 [Microtus ochrogaster]|uniref:40S ribosomal protein S6 n=1 Tax=Microtus ochrogaster TaxID=79684 RepID=A0A8J6KXG1_MICOH|nr:40S ribosomal protein S6 [Microtus ochrogaster]